MAIAITGIAPAEAPATGATVHRITGTDLDLVTSVTVGGTPAIAVNAEGPTLMKVTVPAHATGAVNVVLNPGAVTGTGLLTYVTPTSVEELASTGALDWWIRVNTGTPEAKVWTDVRALGEIKPMEEGNFEDDSDNESEGYASEAKTQVKWGAEVKVWRKRGIVSNLYDPGQEFLRQKVIKFGGDGVAEIQMYDKLGGPEAYQGYVNVGWEHDGGGAKDVRSATVTLSGKGKRTTIVNPAA